MISRLMLAFNNLPPSDLLERVDAFCELIADGAVVANDGGDNIIGITAARHVYDEQQWRN